MSHARPAGGMFRGLLAFSSLANLLGGLVLLSLVATGTIYDPGHSLPYIAIAIGGVMLVQGLYSAGFAQQWWRGWGEMASGALLAGQLIAGFVAIATLVYAVFYNARASNGGVEPGPFFSGVMIGANAVVALALLYSIGDLRPKTLERAGS